MIDTVQAVLLFVIVLLTVLLVILGIQVYFILRDFRNTIAKANKVLDNTGSITESFSRPISSLSSLVDGVSTGTMLAKLIKLGIRFVSKAEGKEHRKE